MTMTNYSAGDGTNVDFNAANVFGRSSNAFGTGTGERLAATTGGADGTNKMWLPTWIGETMTAYDQYRIFTGMTESRNISSGREAQFPIMGTVALKPAWGAGEELVGNTNDHVSKTVAVRLDARPFATHFELDNVDLMITEWEYRAELARQAGQTLANARDLQVGSYLVRAAAEEVLSDDPRLYVSGSSGTGWRNTLKNSPMFADTTFANLGNAGASDDARADAALLLLSKFEQFMVHLRTINADTSSVYCAVDPQTFQDIRALGVARDHGDLTGGAGRPFFGGVAEAGGLGAPLSVGMWNNGDKMDYQGVTIVSTTHIPNFDASADPNKIGEDRYNLDFATAGVKAVIWQPKAVAQLNTSGIKVDTVDDVRRNSVFTVASMFGGTGVVRPECASVVTSVAHADRTALQSQLSMTPEYANTTA